MHVITLSTFKAKLIQSICHHSINSLATGTRVHLFIVYLSSHHGTIVLWKKFGNSIANQYFLILANFFDSTISGFSANPGRSICMPISV